MDSSALRRPLACKASRRCRALPRTAARAEASDHAKQANKQLFVFGLGYTSVALGNWLSAEGWNVSGTCRTQPRVAGLRSKGWAVDVYDPARGVGLTPELCERLATSPYVLCSVPPLGLALYDPALAALKAVLRPLAASGQIRWFGYLSSTGVYGDWQGEWVDESSPCRQTSSKAVVRQEAETAWLEMHRDHGLPTHIFRLGGIYGPGRSVLESLEAKPSELTATQQRRGRQRYTARCHVYDICAVLAASMARPNPPRVYNVADDDPAPRGDVVAFARTLVYGNGTNGDGAGGTSPIAGVAAAATSATGASAVGGGAARGHPSEPPAMGPAGAPPQVQPPPPQPQARSEGRQARQQALDEKRVRAERLRAELGVALRYPSYREGVAAIHAGEVWPLSGEDLALL